jgi:hypothetical protein
MALYILARESLQDESNSYFDLSASEQPIPDSAKLMDNRRAKIRSLSGTRLNMLENNAPIDHVTDAARSVRAIYIVFIRYNSTRCPPVWQVSALT